MKRKTVYRAECMRSDGVIEFINFQTKKGFYRFENSNWDARYWYITIDRITTIVTKGKKVLDGKRWGADYL